MIPQIAMVSTYPPTRCGVANSCRSLASAMARLGTEVRVVRLTSDDRSIASPAIAAEHRGPKDLTATGRVLNDNDLVILQHDFAIFDGPDGEGVLDIVKKIRVPLVTVLHSVSAAPTHRQRRIIQALLNASEATVVLSHAARRIVMKTYDVDGSRLFTIPHGAPDIPRAYRSDNLRMRPRMLSWGLLRPGKGFEWGIAALADLRELEPMPDYFIVGQTHPDVVQSEGLAYRRHLEQMAQRLDVADRVHFIDDYLDPSTLIKTIASADFYLLPNDTSDQVTSGVLAEAMAAGGPIIATRFAHAIELLGDGTGLLVNQGDPQSIAKAVQTLVRDPITRQRMRRHTLHKAQSFLWPSVGAAFVSLTHGILSDRRGGAAPPRAVSVPA